MSVTFELTAEVRQDTGKGASRRLRRANLVPGILYGARKEPLPLSVPANALLRHLDREAFYSSIITLKVDGQTERAVLKDLQRDPRGPFVLHLDLQRISETEKLRMHVPLHFVGEDAAPGIKQGGGMAVHNKIEVEVSCLAKDLPEFIEVDLSTLHIGDAVHLSDIRMPEGVELLELTHGTGGDLSVASIHGKKSAEEEVEEEAAAEASEG